MTERGLNLALFALSDLHLSLSIDKPMDVFGPNWQNYMERIPLEWSRCVSDDDLVIVAGDSSWATYLNEANADFGYINSLPGRKLLLKGNHDYWWESVTKLNSYVSTMGFDTISFLHNSAYIYDGFSIAGTRGWLLPGSDGFGRDDRKIYDRELIRLSLSLDEAVKLEEKNGGNTYTRIAVLHYPPVNSAGVADEGIMNILLKYGVKKCIYGHLHGGGAQSAFNGNIEGIDFYLTSADYLGFTPLEIV